MKSTARTVVRRKPTDIRQMEIVDAAMRIIASHGSRRFTVKLLAAEVGVTEGAIFRHFPNMDAIVDGVIDLVESILFADFPPRAADPLARLGLFFQHRVRAILANPHISRLLLSDHLAQAGGVERAARLEEFKRRSQTFVIACLREAKAGGSLSDGVSPEAGAVLVLGSILALSHAKVRVGGGTRVEKLAQEVWAALERTLRGPQEPAGSERPRQRPHRADNGGD